VARYRWWLHSRPVRGGLSLLIGLCAGVGSVVAVGPAQAGAAQYPPAVGQLASVATGTMTSSHRIASGGQLLSPDRFVSLRMQRDGNLALWAGGRAMWSSRTTGRGGYAEMTANGTFSVRTVGNQLEWSARTTGPGNILSVQNDGNLVIRSSAGKALWNTGTVASELRAGSALTSGQSMSGRGGDVLTMGTDGNLVLRSRMRSVLWNSGTPRHPGAFLSDQTDGNLVLYWAGRALWNTHSAGSGAGSRVVLGADGNLALLSARGAPLWQTFTGRGPATSAASAGKLLTMWGGRVVGSPGAYSDLLATNRNQTIRNSDSCWNTVRVDTRLLQFLLRVTATYKIKINNIVTGHGCDSAQHPKGRATDLGGAWQLASGTFTSFGGAAGANNLELDRVFVNYISTILPDGAGLGQRTCPGQSAARPRAGVQFFPDSCNHQHIQLP